MPSVPLPGFAGVSFFSAVVQQQRRASGCLLPVPAVELPANATDRDVQGLDDSCTTSSEVCNSSPDDWVQQAVQLTQDLGFVPQPISNVAAAAPLSKAEKSLNKQSRKGLWQQMQPAAKQLNTATVAGAGPALAQFTAQYVSSFSGSDNRSSNNQIDTKQAAVHMAGLSLTLDEPVIPEADTVWGKEAHVQGPTVMLCEPGELQQLRQEVPEHTDTGAWDAAFTKVCPVAVRAPAATDGVACSSQPAGTAAAAAGASTPPTAAAPAVMPSVKQVVHAWVLQQHELEHSSPTAAVMAPTTVSAEEPQHSNTQPAESTAEGPAATAEAGPAVEQSNPHPASSEAAACAGQSTPAAGAGGPAGVRIMPVAPARGAEQQQGISRPQQLQGATLDEPALPFAWLQLQQSTPDAAGAAITRHCPVSSIKIFQDTAAAEQADYIDSILAAANHASTASTMLLSKASGIICLEVPAQQDRAQGTGATHARAAPQLQQAQQPRHLLLPASAVPTAVHMPPALSTHSSSKEQPGEQTGADASKPQLQQSTAKILLGWMGTISNPKGKKQAMGGGAEAHVKKRQSAAAPRTARNTPRVSMQQSTGTAGRQAPSPGAPKPVPAKPAADVHTSAAPVGTEAPGLAAAAATTQRDEHHQHQQDLEQPDQAAADSQAGGPETQDDSCCGELSPGSLLIEVPVCMLEQPSEPLGAKYCRAALSAAQAVLDAIPDLPDLAAAHGPAGDDGTGSLVWDASWGDLGSPVGPADSGAGAKGTAAAAASAWCTPAVLDMLTGATLQASAAASSGAAANKQLEAGPGFSSSHIMHQEGEGGLLGASLLEQMVAADMQLGDHDSSLLLPVLLFPDSDDCWSSGGLGNSSTASAGTSICADLRMQCGYKRQSTAHLELYFDWSYCSSSGMKRNSSCLFSAAGVKRRKSAAGGAAAMLGPQLQGKQMQPQDAHAWLQMVLSHSGLKQLQQDFSKRQAVPAGAAFGVAQVSQSLSKQVLAAYLQQADEPQSASHPLAHAALHVPTVKPSTQRQPVTEVVPSEVAAAAAAWRQACSQAKAAAAAARKSAAAVAGAAGQSIPTTLGAPASATVAAAAGAPSDLDFFVQLQGAQARRSKRRHSLVAPKGMAAAGMAAATEAVDVQQGVDVGTTVPAVQAVSLSPAGEAPAKRARLVSTQQQQQQQQQRQQQHAEDDSGAEGADGHGQERAWQQRQQDAALATADLALNGVLRGVTALQVAAAAAAEAGTAAGPTVRAFRVSGPILQLLLQLDGMRRSVLSAMQCPGPDLVESLLWQDNAAQQQLLQLKALQQKQKQETGQGPSAQQRQHNKQLVVLVLLSQTAACLLHYGIQVAHMFLQHGLQRLPSILDACRPALSALSTASDALDRQPAAPGVATGASRGAGPGVLQAAGGEHPKLAHLRDLMLQLKSAKRDCKLLLVAESKAFFNLYHALSATGIIAVQLDRDRKLPMAVHAGSVVQDAAAAGPEGGANSTADPAVQAAWAAGVQSALSAASCVLATHEQLHHPCMPLQGLHVLVEYVAWEDTSTGTAAAGAARPVVTDSSKAAVSTHFGPGKHFVFSVEEPNLAQAAIEAEQAVAHAAADATGVANTITDAGVPAAACRTPAVRASPHQLVHGPSAQTPAAAVTTAPAAKQGAAARAAVAPEAAADAGQELPLVLNVSPGGSIKRRQSLYHSLMQLEAQGYVLVERPLGGSSKAGEAAGGAAALVAMAVDIVLTPRACLCIWDESKLPREPELAMQALSRALLALSMSYDCVYFLFELGDGLLQPILRSSTSLQGLARAAAVKLQLLTCFSAANTQDAVLHICKEATSSFWTLSPADGSSSSSTGLQPPLGLSDLPTATEAQLAACLALNPLSAAVLASHGATLSALFELVMSDEGQQHALLQALLPARSLQLLQVQASAVAERIQQQRQQEQDELLQQSPGGQQHQQQGAYQAAPQVQQQQQQYMADRPDGQYQHGANYQVPVEWKAQQPVDQQQYGYADAGVWEPPGVQQYSQQYQGMSAQQLPWQQQQQQQQQHQGPAFDAHGQMPGGPAGHYRDPMQDTSPHMPHSNAWQDAGQLQHMQQDPWADSPATGPRAVHRVQQRMQRRQRHGAQAGPEFMQATGFDPSAVLDDFLSGRSPAGAPPVANQGSMDGRTTGMAAARPGMPTGSYSGLPQQYSRAGQANGGQRRALVPGKHQQQWASAGDGAYAAQPRHAPPNQGRARQQAGMRRGPDTMYGGSPWAAADDDAAGLDGFGGAPGSADFLQVTHDDAFADAGEAAEPWDQLDAGREFELNGMQDGWQGQQASRQVHGRGARTPARQAPGVPDEHMFDDEGELFDEQQPMSVRRSGSMRKQGQGGGYGTEHGLPQRGASRGGMFAATPSRMQGFEADVALFDSEPVGMQAPGARRTAGAAAGGAGGAGMQARRPHPMTGGAAGYGSRGQTGHRGFAGPTSSNTSGLSVPAFMPHHNPSKQLKYRVPAAAGGVVKRKKGGKGGFQTKLCWG